MSQHKDKSFNFEKGIGRLEEIVEKLESGNLSLDDSLKYFEEGITLSRLCTQKLSDVEKKIDILIKDKNGNIELKPFTEEGQTKSEGINIKQKTEKIDIIEETENNGEKSQNTLF